MVKLSFELNGERLSTLAHVAERTEVDLLRIAHQLAMLRDTLTGDIRLRFAEDVDASSAHPPPEEAIRLRADALVQLVFEQHGLSVQTLPYVPHREEGDLLTIAQQLAASRNVPFHAVTLRFVDAFEEGLAHFPPEEMVEEDDPAYPDVEADGGCRTCAGGEPCRERIRADIADILTEAGLTGEERLSCLTWMVKQGYSSLTQSIQQMAAAFREHWRVENAKIIAAQNDAFRSQAGLTDAPMLGETPIPGIVLMTPGIQGMSLIAQAEILRRVRRFAGWTPENDPHGEHDFGAFTYQGERIYFKIDYYDPDLTYGSENPADLSQTRRVLTVMTAQEY